MQKRKKKIAFLFIHIFLFHYKFYQPKCREIYWTQSYTQQKAEKLVDDENNDKSVSYRCHDIDWTWHKHKVAKCRLVSGALRFLSSKRDLDSICALPVKVFTWIMFNSRSFTHIAQRPNQFWSNSFWFRFFRTLILFNRVFFYFVAATETINVFLMGKNLLLSEFGTSFFFQSFLFFSGKNCLSVYDLCFAIK